ncbi:M12 family metallo-peptidase [Kribbella sp. NPDC051952]|uniref:M12 family metallo-peptidase n=1 Tax=Kribbella sp. NPDC051952 TaxID=3154851 RepID=UPI003419315D
MSDHFALPARPLRRRPAAAPASGFIKKAAMPVVAAVIALGATMFGAVPAQAAEPSGEWYQGYQFAQKSVCLESNIPNAPLAAVAAMYQVNGIQVAVRSALGQCAAAGFARSQYVPITAYQADDNMCAGSPTTYDNGYIVQAAVIVNLQPDTKLADGSTRYYSSCRNGAEWTDTFAHEVGHTFGLSHSQPYSTSMMRDGHTTDTSDRSQLGLIYANNPD